MSLLLIILVALFVLTPKQLINMAQQLGQLAGSLRKLRQQFSSKLQAALNHLDLQDNLARAEQAEKTNSQIKL